MRKTVLNQVTFSTDDLSEIQGCFVCKLTDGVDDDGDEVIFLTFFNPMTGKYIEVEFGEHGFVFVSDPYNSLE